MSSIRTILGALIITAACNLKETRKYSITTTNPQKRSSSVKSKKKVVTKQMKYTSTKPIKKKSVTQFRNKSNI